MREILLTAVMAASASAQVCGANDLFGAYGYQLAGTNTISGTTRPSAAIGRLVFEAGGVVSGTASVNFDGLFLGNPVTGKYTFDTDCKLSFELQDPSGGYEHFRGEVNPGGDRGSFTQTDTGADGHGVLHKLADSCDAATLRGEYAVVLDSRRTTTAADGKGGLSWTSEGATNSGSYAVDSDCFMEINFGMKLRGVLVDGGRTILAVQTDPLQISTATFTAQ
jgi:hypothetical protein